MLDLKDHIVTFVVTKFGPEVVQLLRQWYADSQESLRRDLAGTKIDEGDVKYTLHQHIDEIKDDVESLFDFIDDNWRTLFSPFLRVTGFRPLAPVVRPEEMQWDLVPTVSSEVNNNSAS